MDFVVSWYSFHGDDNSIQVLNFMAAVSLLDLRLVAPMPSTEWISCFHWVLKLLESPVKMVGLLFIAFNGCFSYLVLFSNMLLF